jgi:hypothetical protein
LLRKVPGKPALLSAQGRQELLLLLPKLLRRKLNAAAFQLVLGEVLRLGDVELPALLRRLLLELLRPKAQLLRRDAEALQTVGLLLGEREPELLAALLNLSGPEAHFLLAQRLLTQLARDLCQRSERLLPAPLTRLGLLLQELRLQSSHRPRLLSRQVAHPAGANGRGREATAGQLLVERLLLRPELGLQVTELSLP